MYIKEAIILAGGQGTRLRGTVPDLPKCMAPVAGKPFIAYQIDYLVKQGIEQFVFALGYKHEMVEAFLNNNYSFLNFRCSAEEKPLGTGGAIRLAATRSSEENFLVLNGDTFFNVDFTALISLHLAKEASCTLCLKPMNNFDRYSIVQLNDDHSVATFHGRQFYPHGLINGGVYALNKAAFEQEEFPASFSFEKEYLEKQAGKTDQYQRGEQESQTTWNNKAVPKLFGLIQDTYFIDIGIPEDYERAQSELPANIV